jgi:RNA polymerase sigma-70 factor (ECF subfamily)
MDPWALPLTELTRKCLESNSAEAWTHLIQRLQPVLARVIYHVAFEWGYVRSGEIDDIVQETFLKIGANRGQLLLRLPLENDAVAWSYFKVIAANSARDYLKSRYATKRGETKTLSLEANLSELKAAFSGIPGIESDVLLSQIDAALNGNPQERTIFWLYYRQGFTAKEIAAVPAFELTAKGVESVIYRLTAALKKSLTSRRFQVAKGESAGKAS